MTACRSLASPTAPIFSSAASAASRTYPIGLASSGDTA